MAVLLLCCGFANQIEKRACTAESFLDAPGKWIKIADDINNPIIPAAQVPPLLKKMEAYFDLLRGAVREPSGFDAQWYRSIRGEPLFKNGPQRHEVTAGFFRFSCDNGVLEPDLEYSDQVAVMANDFWHMSGIARFNIGGKRALILGSPIGEIRGYPLLEPNYSAINAGLAHSYKWVALVTRPGKSPFRYLTRKEVLDHPKAVNEKKRTEALALAEQLNPIRPQPVQEAEKEKELARFINGAKDERQRQNWTERFNKDYRTDAQKREEAQRKMNSIHDAVLKRLQTVEARDAALLQEPALVRGWLINEAPNESFDFAPPKKDRHICAGLCGEPHGKPLVTIDESYFDPSLPRSSPQFFIVTFRWEATERNKYRDPKFEKLRDEFFERFDFDRLAAMLGK
jgi:hypothetical protein